MQPESKTEGLSKIQTTEQFEKLFQSEENTNCFQCGKKSKQWAETKHAVFLCLSCAAIYRDVMKVVNVKSIGLDLWYPEDIALLKVGGNNKFREFLNRYELSGAEPKISLRSTAANYYRKRLVAESTGVEVSEGAPTIEQGKKPYVAEIPITEMTSDQILEQAKIRMSYMGDKTKEFGTKAYEKIHHKITSGQLKDDAKKAAEKVSTKAKDLWSFLSTKIDELKKPKQDKPKQATEL